eukprot:8726271-Pyramimonas_sp.AAC.1
MPLPLRDCSSRPPSLPTGHLRTTLRLSVASHLTCPLGTQSIARLSVAPHRLPPLRSSLPCATHHLAAVSRFSLATVPPLASACWTRSQAT